MIIDDELFRSEFSNINASTQNPVNFTYTAEFIDSKNNIIPVHNVLRITYASNFIQNFSDDIRIVLDMYKSNYFKLLKVNRRMLTLRLTKTECSMTGEHISFGSSTSKIYDAALTDNTSETIETRIGALTGTSIDDLGELKEVKVQLIERGYSEFRLIDCMPNVYKNCNITTLMQAFMSTPIKTLDPNLKTGYGCTVYPVDNEELFYQRIIPCGIKLYKFPRHMQDTRGVYGNGLGSYLTNGMWYIFPLYNVERYLRDTSNKLTIINVPQNEMIGNNNSYFMDKSKKELYIFATGKTKHIDSSDRYLNKVGTGFRSVNSSNLLDTFVQKKKGVLTVPKGQNLMSVTFDDRDTDLENINTTRPITGNRFKEASRVTKAFTNTVVLNWEFSNLDLLYPNMPLKLIYKVNGVPNLLYGVLNGIQTTNETSQQSITDNRYRSTSQLILTTQRATR